MRSEFQEQLINERQRLVNERSKIDLVLKAMDVLLGDISRTNTPRNLSLPNPKDVPTEFSACEYMLTRVYYVLKTLGNGTVNEVAEKWIEFDNTLSLKIAKKKAKGYLSTLYNNGGGIINAVRAGKGNSYRFSIKQENI